MKIEQVSLTSKEIERCKDFAERTYQLHENHRRSSKKKIHDIFIGKLGEVAFSKMNEGLTKVNFQNEVDPGYDFLNTKTNETIDVKTIDEEWKQRIYVNPNRLHADIYVSIFVDQQNYTAWYLGKLTKKQIEQHLKYDKIYDAHYVLKNKFIIEDLNGTST